MARTEVTSTEILENRTDIRWANKIIGIVGQGLTISVRQAGVAAHRAVTLEDDRPLDRHASGDRNVKF